MAATVGVGLDQLYVDPALQPRVDGVDAAHVAALIEAPEKNWPPLVAVARRGRYVLVDGFHRFAAAQNLKWPSVQVQVVPEPEDGDLYALAFSLNAGHGKALSLKDRCAFAARLLRQHPDWADREIGRRCGLSQPTVARVRRELEQSAQLEQTDTRVGAGGYTYTASSRAPSRQRGALPEPGVGEMLGETVGRLFTSAERTEQKRVARYLERLAVALEDQAQLKGWTTAKEIAKACREVLGAEKTTALGQRLGATSRIVLDVARALGYVEGQ
jgi:ParB-like chromosome segregation protein Spo0J